MNGLEKATKPVRPISSGEYLSYELDGDPYFSNILGFLTTSWYSLWSLSLLFSIVNSPLSASSTPYHEFDLLLQPYASLFTSSQTISTEKTPKVELPGVDVLVAEQSLGSGERKVKDEWEGLF